MFIQRQCQNSHKNHTKALKATGRPFCAVGLDKTACWGPVAAGMSQAWPCPLQKFPRTSRVSISYPHSMTKETVPSYLPRAVRVCAEDGNWTTPGADLSRCELNESYRKWRVILQFGGNGISLVALIFALGVFFYNKKLLTLSNQIHCHFFLAVCIQIIAEYLTQTYVVTLLKKTSMPVCYSLLALLQFSWLANFAWLLAEGSYIILLNMWIFGLESLRLWNFGIMAWGVPMYLTVIWIFVDRVRGSRRCFDESQQGNFHSWYIDGPILFSLAIGCGIACFCIIKLHREERYMTKMSSKKTTEDLKESSNDQGHVQKRKTYSQSLLLEQEEYDLGDKSRNSSHKVKIPVKLRKAIIAYLVLISYHIMYVLLLYIRVPFWLKEPWILGDILFQALQGFVVALMLCFLNYDVRMTLSRSFREWRDRRQGLAVTTGNGSIHSSNYSLQS